MTSRIKQVRRAVGDDGTSQTHVRTYHGRGYRFVAEATESNHSRRARGLVDEVGVGVAIDEVSRDSDLVSGHGVDVAMFFARLATPGEVLLPNVIKQLLAGSGLAVTTLEPVDLPYVGPHPVHRWVRR